MAVYYAINAGGNWTAGETWSTISAKDASRVGGATAPTSADTCYLDDYSGNVTINAASACLIINENGNGAYGGTLAFGTQTLTVSGAATLRGAMTSTSGTLSVAGGVTLAGTPTGTFPTLTATGTQTLTSGGFTWEGALNLSTSSTKTLVGNWVNTGLVTSVTTTQTVNWTTNETLTCNGGLTVTGAMAGTATIIIGGTGGTVSGLGGFASNLTFNCTTATIGTSLGISGGSITYIAGTITTTNSFVRFRTAACTLNTNGITWNNLNFEVGTTFPLSSNLTCIGILTILSSGSPWNTIFSGAYNISCATLRYLATISVGATTSLQIPMNQTLTVTTNLYINGNESTTLTIRSSTALTSFLLTYQGTAANCKVFAATFTDVDASGSTQRIDNWYGGTLLRTVNIVNRTSADLKTTGGWGAGTVTQYTGALARGGSGSAVLLNPSSTTDKLIWTFLVPTTAATPFTLKFWHLITASYNGSMKVTVYDTDNTTKLLTENSVTFTDDAAYHQYSAGALTPTATGFCRILCEILNGAVSGDIYVDDVTST